MKFIRHSGCLLLMVLVACSGQMQKPAIITAVPPSPATGSWTPTPAPALTSTPATTSTAARFVQSDRLRMAYEVDGNLFIKTGGSPALQLTESGKDQRPVFSDDGEKIVFSRGGFQDNWYKNVYSINSDGSREQPLVTASAMIALHLGYDQSSGVNFLQFIPGTHQLFFNTEEIDLQSTEGSTGIENQDLLLVDSDTGKIRQILPPGKGGPFKVSPDGRLVEIVGSDHIAVLGIDGQIRFRNLWSYPAVKFPSDDGIDWTQDAGELIVSLPVITWIATDLTGPMPTTFQIYSMDNGRSTGEIQFNPLPPRGSYAISPDGNWIVYLFYDYSGAAGGSTPEGVYLGNMRNGESHVYDSTRGLWCDPVHWSPASDYFICPQTEGLMLGTVQESVRIIPGSEFLGWADALHFYYLRDDIIWMEDVGGKEILSLADYPVGVQYLSQIIFFYEP